MKQRTYSTAEGRQALATGRFPVDVPAGKVKGPRGMNKLEARFAQEALEPARIAGLVMEYAYEDTRLRLANGAWYKPDFRVVYNDGATEFIEVKGFWREAARLRLKIAAEKFPLYRFVAVRRIKRDWIYERFGA